MPKSSFRINKEALIEEVGKRRAEAQERFEADRDGYDEAVEQWKTESTAILEKGLAAVAKGRPPGRSRYDRGVVEVPAFPKKPKRADYVARFDRTLEYLGKVDQAALTLDQEGYERIINGR
jgi:hypothetical protein